MRLEKAEIRQHEATESNALGRRKKYRHKLINSLKILSNRLPVFLGSK
jgi:hypothetical protein